MTRRKEMASFHMVFIFLLNVFFYVFVLNLTDRRKMLSVLNIVSLILHRLGSIPALLTLIFSCFSSAR